MRVLPLLALLSAALLPVTLATAQAPQRGSLFSAIVCSNTPFGEAWARLLPVAQARFPGLKFTHGEDLHVTVVYVGPGWKPEDLVRLRPLALTGPAAAQAFTPEVVSLGAKGQVVAVELHGSSPAWGEAVNAAKAELNRLGLKRADAYDAAFRPHLTLAQAAHNPPDDTDHTSLAAFLAWMKAEIARDPQPFTLTLGPATPVRLLLAGTVRPAGAPEYVSVEESLGSPSTN